MNVARGLFCLLISVSVFMEGSLRWAQVPLLPQFGSIAGTLSDGKSNWVPGAKIEITKDAFATILKTAESNEKGAFSIAGIPVGGYRVRFSKVGFETITQDHVDVKADSITELDVVMTPTITMKSEITVTAQPGEEVAAGSAIPEGRITEKTFETLPLKVKKIEESLPIIPGVIRTADGRINIKGGIESQSTVLVNQANSSDPVTGNFVINIPVDAVESVQVFKTPYLSEYGRFSGGVTTVETKPAGPKWEFSFNDFLPDPRIKNGSIVGIADDTPRLSFSGPLIRNRIGFAQSFEYDILKSPVRGLSFPGNETKTEAFNSYSRFDFILSNQNVLTTSFNFFPQTKSFQNLNFFNPQTVTPNFKQRGYTVNATDNYSTQSGGLLTGLFQYTKFDAYVWGQGILPMVLQPQGNSGNFFNIQNRFSHRLETLLVYALTPKTAWGTHELKFGAGLTYSSYHGFSHSLPIEVRRADGSLEERDTFVGAGSLNQRNYEGAIFIQDRWMMHRNFTVDLGIRYNNQTIADAVNFAPRIGFAYSPFKNEKTVLRGGFGLFYDKVPLNATNFHQQQHRIVTFFGPDGITPLGPPQFYQNVIIDVGPRGRETILFNNPDFSFTPYNVSWNIELDHRPTNWAKIRLNYLRSYSHRLFIVEPGFFGITDPATVLSNRGRGRYYEFDSTVELKLRKEDTFTASYVQSKARGDLNEFNYYFGNTPEPLLRPDQFSNLPFDTPERFIAYGAFHFPLKITASPIFEARRGFPYSVADQNQNFVGIRNADIQRFPNFIALDLAVSKEFHVWRKYRAKITGKVFNLTDHFNPRDIQNNIASPQFGQFFSDLRRFYSADLEIEW
ncbi:MAG: carboxypeptidase regulatory-like domain-containing protein [Acidobacteriia bacterium]|nr:carboxypeptidase regulatory-like domain-containing protein [Terriglobia bacterium]